jgi:hypothetical protein
MSAMGKSIGSGRLKPVFLRFTFLIQMMNFMKFLVFFPALVLFVWGTESVQAQTAPSDKKDNKVEIFTDEERDNLQIWFYNETKSAIPEQEIRDEYYSVVLYYVVKMKRLNDKDKGLSKDKVYSEYLKLQKKQNKEVKKILNNAQYAKHLEWSETLNKSVLEHLNRM